MILIYTLLMFLLSTFKFLVNLRARALERKFVRVAASVDELARQPEYKPGNSNKADPCVSAKRMLLLGQLVQRRDRIEAKHFAWQHWTERLGRWVDSVRTWQGKKLPYTLGAVDVWMLLGLIDYAGVGQYLSAMAIFQAALSLLGE